MSDEIAENGTANGDVPEIELIIKVDINSHVLIPKISWLHAAVKSTTRQTISAQRTLGKDHAELANTLLSYLKNPFLTP